MEAKVSNLGSSTPHSIESPLALPSRATPNAARCEARNRASELRRTPRTFYYSTYGGTASVGRRSAPRPEGLKSDYYL